MSKKLLAAAAAATLLSPAFAVAQESPHSFGANVGLYSQYVFRGLAQTNEEPAIQGGFDYSYAFSGAPVTFYAGTWGSNISWLQDANLYSGGGSLELDFYGGLKGNIGASDFTWDVGYLYYWYPGDTPVAVPPGYFIDADTQELYAALGWKWFTVKYSYAISDAFGFSNSDGSDYLDISASVPLGETGLTAGAHWGTFNFDNNSAADYDDWKVSLTYDMGKLSKVMDGVTVGVAYTDTNGKKSTWTDANNENLAGSATTVWISKAF